MLPANIAISFKLSVADAKRPTGPLLIPDAVISQFPINPADAHMLPLNEPLLAIMFPSTDAVPFLSTTNFPPPILNEPLFAYIVPVTEAFWAIKFPYKSTVKLPEPMLIPDEVDNTIFCADKLLALIENPPIVPALAYRAALNEPLVAIMLPTTEAFPKLSTINLFGP